MSNSTQEELSQSRTPHWDSSSPLQPSYPRDGQVSQGLENKISPCLHAHTAPLVEDLAEKRNRERNSYHSAPTQNSETVAATLIGTKNDFISRRTAKEKGALSPTGVARSQLRAQAQLMDVLNRVQKLEDLQHARNMELTKVGQV